LRLRLGRGEVSRLVEGGSVEEVTEFAPGQRLEYVLRTATDVASPQASFRQGRIEVLLPSDAARRWATGDEVGISGEQEIRATGGGSTLRLLIEKDFACRNPEFGEDQSDAFPNPLPETACPPPGAAD
jgi:hypothetical protein